MAETKLNETFRQVKELIIEMPLLKKLSILITIAVSLGVLGFLSQLSSKSGYQVLFSNLESEDIGAITAALDKYKIQYKIQSYSKAVMVPGDSVLDARLKLARDGLPRFGGVGFEIFDKTSFGMTDFEQRLNYQRALQGELQRTINEFKEIEDSRVHLVIPQESVFLKNKESATASIVLKVEKGEKVGEETVRSIIHLISASVSNLDKNKVTVSNTEGELLTADFEDGDAQGAGNGIEKKRDVESVFEQKVKTLLEPIVGLGKIKVRVTADLDLKSRQTTEEKFDPDSVAVRTETKTRDKESDNKSDGKSEAATAENATAKGKQKDLQTETTTYEVSKQVEQINHPIGEIKSLSIAVIVDGVYNKNTDGTTSYAPRSAEEIKSFEDIIRSAVGFNDKRGDQIKVMNLAFQNPEALFARLESSPFANMNSYTFYLGIVVNLVIAIIALLIIFFVVRPVLVSWNSKRRVPGAEVLADGTTKLLSSGEVRQALGKKALSDPADMVQVLRKWLE